MEHEHFSNVFEHPKHSAITCTAANEVSNGVDCQLEHPIRPLLGSTFTPPNTVATQQRAKGNDAAIGIGQAYDRFHRIQAILAYLKIINRNDRRFSPILDEAKHTYGQALSLYEARDFEGALELASASGDLFQALEIVISSGLRSDSLYPTLVPLPPAREATLDDLIRMQEELYRVERQLARIHRVAENGTSLSQDQTQTLKITSVSERLLRQARHLLKFPIRQEGIDLVHAAALTACAAEYVCKRWYSMQRIDPFLPPDHTRDIADESSGRDCDSIRGSRTLDLQQEES